MLLADWIIEHLMHVEAITVLGQFGVSKHVLGLFIVAFMLMLTFVPFGAALQADPLVPRGRLVNFLETILLFLRDDVTRPFMGKAGDRYLPVLWTLFFFILYCNLLGLVPVPIKVPVETGHGTHWSWFGTVTPTGQVAVTGTLALIAGLWWHGLGIKEQGLITYIKNLVPGGLPVWLIVPFYVIEIFGHMVKIAALMIRLWANMMGGHAVLCSMLGLIFLFGAAMGIVAVPVAFAVYLLEIFVAFLQAYVFCILTCLYLNDALHLH